MENGAPLSRARGKGWLFYVTGTITVTNAYTGNPDFVFEGFTIGVNSAAINRGVPAGVSRDFYGDLRVGAPDLGADEVVLNVFLPITLRDF